MLIKISAASFLVAIVITVFCYVLAGEPVLDTGKKKFLIGICFSAVWAVYWSLFSLF